MNLVPPSFELPPLNPEDPRLGHLLAADLGEGEVPRVAIVGLPTDVGVRRNGGRPGAAEGPAALRRALYRLTPDPSALEPFCELVRHTRDLGDVPVSEDLEEDQAALGEVVAGLRRQGVYVIVLGGGHESAYGHFLGHALAGEAVDILNLDAHADVRPLKHGKAHSGSPFRQALEHPSGRGWRYRVAGLQPWSVARSHLEFISKSGGEWVMAADVDRPRLSGLFATLTGPAMVSFDLDAVDQAAASGVSAPAVRGLSVDDWLEAALLAGRTPQVASFGLAELSPPLDVSGNATRLAAVTVWTVLLGLATRAGEGHPVRWRTSGSRESSR